MMKKKTYEAPAVIFTEKMEGRALSCTAADSDTCGSGPLQT